MAVRFVITGGAGFVGSTLAIAFKAERPDTTVIAFDNLKRRGSEIALERLQAAGVEFIHGDVRSSTDLEAVGGFDLLVDCAAEPSAFAGYDGSARYVVDTNLAGTVNCLEAARISNAAMIFLSTSRVYPIQGLRDLPMEKTGERFEIASGKKGTGWSSNGIARTFPLDGPRTLYGTTKLCSELIIDEYASMYGMKAVINRCGVLTGRWQMGKVDQGFVTLWAARHCYGGSLSYFGFGGDGLQVRDILHVNDLHALLEIEIDAIDKHAGRTYNVGGGINTTISLRELTAVCSKRSKRKIDIACDPDTRPGDVPYYVTDNEEVSGATGWEPKLSVDYILDDIFEWLRDHESQLETFFK